MGGGEITTIMKAQQKESSPTLLGWIALIVALAVLAYLAGSALARQWSAPPSLALPIATETPPPPSTNVAVAQIPPNEAVEGTLGAEGGDVWQFLGQAGQSATIEVWLHPGSGSSMEAALTIQVIGPDGAALAQEAGSNFLPPYLVIPHLPTSGPYRIQVAPTSGAPGRYSLGLTLSEPSAPGTPHAPQLTPSPIGEQPLAAAKKQIQWPTTRREISGWTFHDPGNPGHIGLDIAAAMWDPIVAIDGGVVVFADWGGGYGNLVIVEHEGGWSSYYAHFSEIVVEAGQAVRQGELLGGAGTTGYSTGPHLHFELRYRGRPVDPHIYLP